MRGAAARFALTMASFYNYRNSEGVAARKVKCDYKLDDFGGLYCVVDCSKPLDKVRVGILDATNSTFARKYTSGTLSGRRGLG